MISVVEMPEAAETDIEFFSFQVQGVQFKVSRPIDTVCINSVYYAQCFFLIMGLLSE
jgi:hypothetical protein